MSDPLTVGDAVDAYKILRAQDPSDFCREMLDEILRVTDALQEAAEYHDTRMQAHAQRIAPDAETVGDMTEDEQEELEGVMADVRTEEADVGVELDITKAATVGVMQEWRQVDALAPIVKRDT